MLELVGEFVDGLRQRVADMRAALDACNWDRLKALGHQLKGAGGSFGYPMISEVGMQVETATREHQTQVAQGLIDQLEQISASAKAGLPRS